MVSVSLIDLIFVNKPDDIICDGTLPNIADHEGTMVCFNTKRKSQNIYDYKNANVEELIKYIKEYDFNNIVFNQPTVGQTEIYTQICPL